MIKKKNLINNNQTKFLINKSNKSTNNNQVKEKQMNY